MSCIAITFQLEDTVDSSEAGIGYNYEQSLVRLVGGTGMYPPNFFVLLQITVHLPLLFGIRYNMAIKVAVNHTYYDQ